MEVIIKVVCFLTLQATFLMDNAAADPGIDINPTEISLGISSALDINCTFSLKNYPDMAALVSLSLSRASTSGQNFQELAVITQFSPDSVNLVTQEKVSATGVNSQTGQSFLQITWEYPTATQGGVYKCAAHGVDMLGHIVEITNTSVVTVDEANLNDIVEKLKQMENLMESHEKSMENTISSMEDHIQNLENTVIRLNAWRQGVIANELELIGTYQNKEYYVSKAGFKDKNESEAVCKQFGGILTEIDDESEYNAIITFLQNVDSGITNVFIGGTDVASEGEWVLPSTNTSLPYTAWHSGQPDGAPGHNCLALYVFPDSPWTMLDDKCHFDSQPTNMRFSCEIPSV